MTDRRERLEVAAWLLFAVSLGAMEGGVVSVMVKTFYRHAVGALTLDYSVAVLVGAPLFGSIASLAWAAAGWRRPARLLVGLQMLCAVCLLLLAAAPRNAAGLAMVVTGAVSGRLLWSGVLTLRTSVWRQCYDRERRAVLAGRVVAVHYLAVAGTGALVGVLVDRRPAALPGLYLLIAGLGLAGASLYRELGRATGPEAARPGEAGEPVSLRGGLRMASAILREDPAYRRYLFWLFVLDAGVQMVPAPLLICLADRFALTHIEQVLLITAVPMAVVPLAMPFFARRLARVHVVRFRAFHSWSYAGALAFSVAGLALRAETLLWLGAALLGVAYAGGSLTWHVGHHDFAPPEKAAHYMALNCTLSGLRGFIGPAAGVSLYRLAEHLLPGQGPLALLIPLGLAVWGASGFAALARETLPGEEPRGEAAGLALPPLKGVPS
ncbi:MAG TPA: MFS transporter [Thermoanaerobaculia bacterium]|nr:MFS transporter [Thermoanaerobaculia bacterium]